MNNKNLPIKIFEKRKKVDERKTEGSGSDKLPNWITLSEDELIEKANEFKSVLNGLSGKLESRNIESDFIPAVLQLNLHELATAKNYRMEIANIFNTKDEMNFIGYTDERSVLVKINNESEIAQINKKLTRPDKIVKGLASITDISEYQPRIDIQKLEIKEPLRVSLLNYNDYQLNNSIAQLFETICKRNNISYRKANYSPDIIAYRLSDVTLDSFKKIKEFDALEAISYMPKYSTILDQLTPAKSILKIKYPTKGVNYPIVGVLDSGIKDIPHLKPWILSTKFSKVPEDMTDCFHGTFVSGIIVYGDELEGVNYVGNDGCYLFDATVFPSKDEIEEIDLVEHIREAIEKNYNEVKIWNLSLGTTKESNKNQFSFFGKALDQIQERYGVLICKSAGNCYNFLHRKPISRISESADSIRSLVVGSIAHEKGEHDISEKYHRSPFSRIGKAPALINKPELTHIGGNAGINEKTGEMSVTGINSLSVDGSISKSAGTSFSTPRITSLLAELNNQLEEKEFNPLLLKALTIHSAKYPDVSNIPNSEKIKSLGYGIPQKVDDILFNDPYESTLILQDTLLKGNWIEISDFPFPANLVEDGFYYGEIIVTLVSAPILSESNGAEYCQSNLEVRLGTYDKLKNRSGKTIRNSIGLDEPINVLRDGLYKSKYRKEHIGEFARERTLIAYGDKYQPIKKYAVSLEEMRPTNRINFLAEPKKWYLHINGLYRDYIIGQSEKDATELSQDFCLIVTIRDNKRKHNVYDSVTNLLNINGFIHSNVNIKNQVKVRVGAA